MNRLFDEPLWQHLDNAAMESFFSSLKTNQRARTLYRTRAEAKATGSTTELFDNSKHRHLIIG